MATDPSTWANNIERLPTVTFLEGVGGEMSWRKEAAKVVMGEDWWWAAEKGKLEVVRAFIEVGGGTWTRRVGMVTPLCVMRR